MQFTCRRRVRSLWIWAFHRGWTRAGWSNWRGKRSFAAPPEASSTFRTFPYLPAAAIAIQKNNNNNKTTINYRIKVKQQVQHQLWFFYDLRFTVANYFTWIARRTKESSENLQSHDLCLQLPFIYLFIFYFCLRHGYALFLFILLSSALRSLLHAYSIHNYSRLQRNYQGDQELN